MRLKLAFVLAFYCFCLKSVAQVEVRPLQGEARQGQALNSNLKRVTAAALALPFFDDFSTSGLTPDKSSWQSGGVYVGPRFGFEPISRNVATFDGLNAAGLPYGPNAVGAGPSDTLTSHSIDLGSLQPSDSVYLSFYWQSGGLGDVPDRTAENTYYLQLEFRDASGNWQQVWRQPAPGTRTSFAQVFIGIKDARYLHHDFQFRLRNIGDRSGMLDVWNLDYVELGKNRRKGVNTSRDFTISRGVSKLLKQYTAMPARQFLAKPQESLSDSVTVAINKLGDLGAISWRAYIKLAYTARADTFLRNQGLIAGNTRFRVLSGKPTVANLPLPGESFVLEHGFKLNTSEQSAKQRANDTTSRKTVFADYFAYDDGTAEAGFNFISSSASHVAQRYQLNLPDQVRGFQVYFPKIKKDLSNTKLTFKVWNNNNGVPGAVLHQQEFQIKHSDVPDTFYEVILTKPVPVTESFFIGWTQPSNAFINIGFDRNENAPKQRFLWNNITNWQADSLTQGAVMMRPLMSGLALGIEEELAADALILYPNPSKGMVRIIGDYKSLQVFDVLGREVYTYGNSGKETTINLTHLQSGTYIVRIETTKTIITKKLILTL